MTDTHWDKLFKKLQAEQRLKKNYEGFADCKYFRGNACGALSVQNCKVYDECPFYQKNPY